MRIDRRHARWLSSGVLLLAVWAPARPDDEVKQKKGTFVRVADPAHIVVSRFNREYFFDLLGVLPVTSLDASDHVETEARAFLTGLLKDQQLTVTLEDVNQGPHMSRYFSGYVVTEDGLSLNEEVLRRGYGVVDDRLSFSRLEAFRSLEKEARTEKRGLWKRLKPDSDFLSAPTCSPGPGPMDVGASCGVSNPEIILGSKVAPEYPRRARRKRIEGRVVLKAIVRKDGTTRVVETLRSPDDQLSDAAIAAVEQWRYKPALKDGRAVDVYFTIVVDFELARGLW